MSETILPFQAITNRLRTADDILHRVGFPCKDCDPEFNKARESLRGALLDLEAESERTRRAIEERDELIRRFRLDVVRRQQSKCANTAFEAEAAAYYEERSFINVAALARRMAAKLDVNQILVQGALEDALVGECGVIPQQAQGSACRAGTCEHLTDKEREALRRNGMLDE